MNIQATAVVKKETKTDPRHPKDKAFYASLSLLNEDGKEYTNAVVRPSLLTAVVESIHFILLSGEKISPKFTAYFDNKIRTMMTAPK